jgi:hypothetical protein
MKYHREIPEEPFLPPPTTSTPSARLKSTRWITCSSRSPRRASRRRCNAREARWKRAQNRTVAHKHRLSDTGREIQDHLNVKNEHHETKTDEDKIKVGWQ